MPYGLPRKIRIAFIRHALLACLAVLLGGYIASLAIRHGLVHVVLQQEADHFWELREASPTQAPPNTRNIQGYLWHTGDSQANVPATLRRLAPGFHDLKSAGKLVLVEQTNAGRLYLEFLRDQATRAAFWLSMVPVLLVLVTILAASWFTYRASTRLVWPVNWLARRVSRWEPGKPEVSELAPDRLPADIQGESRQLALALHAISSRMAAHVARERNFTRDASHELRTPLTVIRMASDMALADPEVSPRLQRSLQRIQRAGRDMEAIIDALLLLAREGDVAPQAEWFDVGEVVRYEADNLEEMLQGRPVELQLSVEGAHPLFAPPRIMHVVIGNLLCNACRYTDAGSIQVSVGDDRVVVRDTGIGMSPEMLARAFDPFFRAEPGNPQGVGLGLAVVRRLCERCGWRIELESVEGQGTTATLYYH